ncbi:MAG: hypothetical protein AAB597_02570 [Patescibacteria group bacterium]
MPLENRPNNSGESFTDELSAVSTFQELRELINKFNQQGGLPGESGSLPINFIETAISGLENYNPEGMEYPDYSIVGFAEAGPLRDKLIEIFNKEQEVKDSKWRITPESLRKFPKK